MAIQNTNNQAKWSTIEQDVTRWKFGETGWAGEAKTQQVNYEAEILWANKFQDSNLWLIQVHKLPISTNKQEFSISNLFWTLQ